MRVPYALGMSERFQFQWDDDAIRDLKWGVDNGEPLQHIAFMLGITPEMVKAKIDELKEDEAWDMIDTEEGEWSVWDDNRGMSARDD